MFVLLVSSCTDEELIKNQTNLSDTLKFTASFEGNDSRIYIDKDNLLHWTGGDKISLFAGNTLNHQYQFEGETGERYGTFSAVNNPSGESSNLDRHYAVYPFATSMEITKTGVISATLPEVQKYDNNYLRLANNAMVAVTQDLDDTYLKFKNVCGYLKLQLYGDDITVKSITLKGNSNEKIAGNVTITPVYGGEPSVKMGDYATETITLDCGNGVKIGTIGMAATDFWFVVPPTNFKKGFTITIYDVNGNEFSKSIFNEVTIERNVISPMSAKKIVIEEIELDPEQALADIWLWMVTFNQTGSGAHDDFGYMGSLHATDMMCEDIVMGASHWFNYDHQLDNNQENYRRVRCHWTNYYGMIAKANEIISLYPDGGNTIDKKGWLGQAQAIRGLAYLHLIQLFQFASNEDGTINTNAPGVPLIYTEADGYTEKEIVAFTGRNTVGDVMRQIEKDLLAAVANLEFGYKRPSKDYIDASVANGILARYYLLANKWKEAADASNKARQGYTMMPATESGLFDGFVSLYNKEWMWGFYHTTETQSTYSSFFSMISNIAPGYAGIGYAPRLIDVRLYNQIPNTDFRKQWFNGPDGATQVTEAASLPYANVKFGHNMDWTENYMYMRAAEMVLIEAEAYAHMGNGTKAAEVLKVLMDERQPGWNETTVTVDDIHLQRRIELWGEGFAYYDLKRLNKGIDRTYEGNNYMPGYDIKVPARDTRWYYQIPKEEINNNDMLTLLSGEILP